MQRRSWYTALLFVSLLVLGAPAVQAQTATNGVIRGIIFQDLNADGICGGGDPAMASVQIDFTPDGGPTLSMPSTSDGTYGLASIELGTWYVTARPPNGWVTTSQPTIQVILTSERNTAENVNFCLAQSGSGGDGSTTLPESGAPAPPLLLVTVALGIVALLGGMGLVLWDWRTSG